MNFTGHMLAQGGATLINMCDIWNSGSMFRPSGYSKCFTQRIKAYETAETLVVLLCFHVAQFELIKMEHQFDLLTHHDPSLS